MNSNLDPEEEGLLNVVLRDEGWQTLGADLKRQAVVAFVAHRRWRRARRWAGLGLALAVLVACAVHWVGQRPSTPIEVTTTQGKGASEPPAVHFMTDQELLASFPKGSCFIAEVDGKKELIFLDPKAERTHMAK